MDQKSAFRLKILLNKEKLSPYEVNFLTNLIIRHNQAECSKPVRPIVPPEKIVTNNLRNLNIFCIFLSKIKTCYLNSGQNFNQFRNYLLNEGEIYYTLFNILVHGTNDWVPVTFDHLDTLSFHLLFNWANICKLKLPELKELFKLIESVGITRPKPPPPPKKFMVQHQGLQYQVIHK